MWISGGIALRYVILTWLCMLLMELWNRYFTLAFVFRFQIGKEWWLIFWYVYSRNVAFISSCEERCICIAQIAWYYWCVALINNIWSIMASGYIRNKTLLFITVTLSWFSITFALFSCSNNVVKVKTGSTHICFAFFSPDFTFSLCFDNISMFWLLIWWLIMIRVVDALELLRIKSHTLAMSRFLGAFPTAFISWPREALRRILIIIKASFPWIWSKTRCLSWLVIVIRTLLPERNARVGLELTYIIRLIFLCLSMRLIWLILWILI